MHHHHTHGKLSVLQHLLSPNRIMTWEEFSPSSRGSCLNTKIVETIIMIVPFMMMHDVVTLVNAGGGQQAEGCFGEF